MPRGRRWTRGGRERTAVSKEYVPKGKAMPWTFTQKQRRDQHNLFCNSLLELSLQQLFYLKVKPYILRIVRDLHVCAIDTISKDNDHYTFIYELRL